MSTTKLTENDQRVLAMAWHCFADMPKVDYSKLAEMGGYKTPASATTAYLNARKKVMGGASPHATVSAGSSTTPAPGTPKATGKKRAATETPAEGTAKKRGRKSKAEMQATPTIETDPDDDENKSVAKIKGEGDVEDDAARKVLSGAQDFINEKAEVKTDDA